MLPLQCITFNAVKLWGEHVQRQSDVMSGHVNFDLALFKRRMCPWE